MGDRLNWASRATGGARVQCGVARGGRVQLEVLDVSGRVEVTLVDAIHGPGRYVVRWDGASGSARPSPGLCFVRLSVPGQVTVRKLAIIR